MKQSKSDKGDKLAKLREKLQNTDIGGQQRGFWSPDDGENVIRIMDAVGDMEYFFQEVGKHWLPNTDGGKGKSKTSVYCPAFTSDGQLPCPICEVVDGLYKGDESSKALAGELRVRKSYWMNVIPRDKEADGPAIYTPGAMVFQQIVAIINDPDYGDIFDEEIGLDLTITRKGKDLQTEYNVIPKRKSTPLHPDPDKVEEWYDKAADLSYVELSENPEEDKKLSEGHAVYLLPYERIVREYAPEMMGDEPDKEEDDEEEEVEQHPARRAIAERRARRNK